MKTAVRRNPFGEPKMSIQDSVNATLEMIYQEQSHYRSLEEKAVLKFKEIERPAGKIDRYLQEMDWLELVCQYEFDNEKQGYPSVFAGYVDPYRHKYTNKKLDFTFVEYNQLEDLYLNKLQTLYFSDRAKAYKEEKRKADEKEKSNSKNEDIDKIDNDVKKDKVVDKIEEQKEIDNYNVNDEQILLSSIQDTGKVVYKEKDQYEKARDAFNDKDKERLREQEKNAYHYYETSTEIVRYDDDKYLKENVSSILPLSLSGFNEEDVTSLSIIDQINNYRPSVKVHVGMIGSVINQAVKTKDFVNARTIKSSYDREYTVFRRIYLHNSTTLIEELKKQDSSIEDYDAKFKDIKKIYCVDIGQNDDFLYYVDRLKEMQLIVVSHKPFYYGCYDMFPVHPNENLKLASNFGYISQLYRASCEPYGYVLEGRYDKLYQSRHVILVGDTSLSILDYILGFKGTINVLSSYANQTILYLLRHHGYHHSDSLVGTVIVSDYRMYLDFANMFYTDVLFLPTCSRVKLTTDFPGMLALLRSENIEDVCRLYGVNYRTLDKKLMSTLGITLSEPRKSAIFSGNAEGIVVDEYCTVKLYSYTMYFTLKDVDIKQIGNKSLVTMIIEDYGSVQAVVFTDCGTYSVSCSSLYCEYKNYHSHLYTVCTSSDHKVYEKMYRSRKGYD